MARMKFDATKRNIVSEPKKTAQGLSKKSRYKHKQKRRMHKRKYRGQGR